MAWTTCIDCRRPSPNSRCAACNRRHRNAYYGSAHRRIAAQLRGQPCHWQYPGCTGLGVEADHLDPADPDSPRVPACRACNLRRRRL